MRFYHPLLLSITLTLVPADAAIAQAGALILFGHGGRQVTLADLSDNGDDLSAAWLAGGGVGLQVGKHYALRGSVNSVKSDCHGSSLQFADPGFRRSFITANVLVGTATTSGLAPYLFGGGGRAIIDPAETDQSTFSVLTAHFGTGANYVNDNTPLVFFAELNTWVYKFKSLGFDKLQFDVALLAGIALVFPL